MLPQFRRQIRLYLDGGSSLQELEEWLLSHLQQILDSSDVEAIEIANSVDADLVEVGEELMDQITFQERLQSYLSKGETIFMTFPERRTAVPKVYGTTAVQTVSVPLVSRRRASA